MAAAVGAEAALDKVDRLAAVTWYNNDTLDGVLPYMEFRFNKLRRGIEMAKNNYFLGQLDKIEFVVIFTKYQDKWVYCWHKQREF